MKSVPTNISISGFGPGIDMVGVAGREVRNGEV